jgi:hypothetical protein
MTTPAMVMAMMAMAMMVMAMMARTMGVGWRRRRNASTGQE